jgi:hypothetical protein
MERRDAKGTYIATTSPWRALMRDFRRSLLASWMLAAQACATSGLGSGVLVTGGQASPGSVLFAWRASPDATRGTISAALPDGREFSGDFLQVTSTTVAQDLRPYYGGWYGGGYGYGGYGYGGYGSGVYGSRAYIRRYTGHVIAQLASPSGERMRCDFQLARPENGPRSGGAGQCEISDGTRIEYAELGR